jgi:hypothetical protein
MPIIKYQKVIANNTTYRLHEPDYGDNDQHCTELATIGDVTYVHVPDGVTLPAQPQQIAIDEVSLTDTLRDQIKAISPHIRLIRQRVVDQIRERYSMNDEIKMIRLAPSEETVAYNAYAEECRDAGRNEKAALGL